VNAVIAPGELRLLLAIWSSIRGPLGGFHGVDRNVGPPDKSHTRVADGEEIEQDALRVLQHELRIPLRVEVRQFLDPENSPHPTGVGLFDHERNVVDAACRQCGVEREHRRGLNVHPLNRRLQQGQRVRRIEQIFKWIVFEVLIRREIRVVIDVGVHAERERREVANVIEVWRHLAELGHPLD
jgi:hypothetical protein